MKFHHLGQLLLDSNCLLIVLKMFGLQEVSAVVATRHDFPELKLVVVLVHRSLLTHNPSFFRYCYTNFCLQGRLERPEDNMLNAPRATTSRMPSPNGLGGDEDVELISTYSWRNFFSSINFLRVVQKLTKQRSHRILLLVQYKASVSCHGSRYECHEDVLKCCVTLGHHEADSQGSAPDAALVHSQVD